MAYYSSNQPPPPPDPYNPAFLSPQAPLAYPGVFTKPVGIFKAALLAGALQASAPLLQLLIFSVFHLPPTSFGWIFIARFPVSLVDLLITGVVAFCTGLFIARKTGKIGSVLAACLVADILYALVASLSTLITPILYGISPIELTSSFLRIIAIQIAFQVALVVAVTLLAGTFGGLFGSMYVQTSSLLQGGGPIAPGQAYPPSFGPYHPQPSYGAYMESAYPPLANQPRPTNPWSRSLSRFRMRLAALGLFICFGGFYGLISGGSHVADNPSLLLVMALFIIGGAFLFVLTFLLRSRH
ncbi:hypothetical protein EPA93_13715 [Ktedonosporobacter rubrisoli]|uniref:Uncharacterized protein n=1 Tax=Ktedonosporobacter rubrisoli TaxID=2509675 RepID=A0A4P6JP78_KTERU|nr:hypothetical protein [Ktedonosporobacter rubrisoli]QBD77003.1 hypothetical protein EPA93_13715 [Ktedonosporobacter rubrisoli]